MIFTGICLICIVLALALPVGMVLSYIFKKPAGQKLVVFGAACATIGFASILISVKNYTGLLIPFIVPIVLLILKKLRKIDFEFFYKIRSFLYFCLICGFVGAIGALIIGVSEKDKALIMWSAFVLVIAVDGFFWIKKAFRRGYF